MRNLIEGVKGWLRLLWLRARSRIFYGDFEFPGCITVEISSWCNHSCHYCVNANGYQPKREMIEDDFLAVCQRLQEIGWRGDVAFNYLNEPLLDKRLARLTKTMKQLVPGCRIVLNTNGDFLTEEKVRELLDCGVKEFCVTRHPPTSINWDENMEHLAAMFRQVKVRSINGARWLTTWAGQVKLPHAVDPYISGCPVITSTYTILADGRVQMCCCDSRQENIVGNILDAGILEIWRTEKFRQLREQAQSGRPTNPTCIACYESRMPA
jgi:radical SAM protein with 4Fe4S-binding SPASM domain